MSGGSNDMTYGVSTPTPNTEMCYGAAGIYCPEANRFFNALGESMPQKAMLAYDTFFRALKLAGTWKKVKYGISCPPILNNSKALIDFVSCKKLASYADSAVSPFASRLSTACPTSGFKLDGEGLSYIKTGFNPRTKLIKNSTCIIESITKPFTVSSNYDTGAFANPDAFTMNNFFTGNLQRSQMYANTAGIGLASFAGGNGAAGVYWANRNGSTFFEVGFNTNQRGVLKVSGGDLPSLEMYLGCLNNAGSPGPTITKDISMLLYLDGLTIPERMATAAAVAQFDIDMCRTGFTKQIVLDGNSHTQYWNEKAFRTYQYNLFGSTWAFTNVGVSGQTTTQMISDEATQIQALYNSAYTKNILVAYEGSNEMFVGSKTKGQAITNMATYVANAQSYGFTVCVKKQFCRTFSGNSLGLSETNWNLAVDAYNTDVDSGLTGANYIIPVSANHFIPRSNYASDALYNTAVAALILTATGHYLDGTHLTESAYKEEADLDSAVLATI